MSKNDKDVEEAVVHVVRKYARHLAKQHSGEDIDFFGTDVPAVVHICSTYLNFLSSKRIEKLTRILSYSTMALAAATFVLAFFTALTLLHR